MSALFVLYAVMSIGVCAYVLSGGADFGAGVFSFFASTHDEKEKKLIERAIAPIWEANHVWLIFVVVLCFSAFPKAFSRVSTLAHIPLSLALLGIVIRGSALTFRAYGKGERNERWIYRMLFGASSLFTPMAFGVVFAATSTGSLTEYKGQSFAASFVYPFLEPFVLGTGIYASLIFVLLAGVYLASDAKQEEEFELAQRFKKRSLWLQLISMCCAASLLLLAKGGAPYLFEGLTSARGIVLQISAALLGLLVLVALVKDKLRAARYLVMAEVATIVLGFALAMRGVLVVPDISISASLREGIYTPMLWALAAGAVLLMPALWFLFRTFRSGLFEET